MVHQPRPLRDGSAEIREVMRIRVFAVDTVRPDRQADIARVAHAMDDFGAWQHQPDEAEIQIVAGHLVDDAARAWRQCVAASNAAMLASRNLEKASRENGWLSRSSA
jgi:hypothetical protein